MKQFNKYKARIINPNDLTEAGKLRHNFFVEQKGWVQNANCKTDIELDTYDPYAVHFGVFTEKNELIGYMRAILGSAACKMMICKDFKICLTEEEFKRIHIKNALELSRRVVSPKLSAKEALEVVQYLFYEFYVFCLKHKIEHVYLVQEISSRKILRKFYGLEFNSVNEKEYIFPDGTVINVDYMNVTGMIEKINLNGMIKNYDGYLNRNNSEVKVAATI